MSWTVYWAAGTYNDQPRYHQFHYNGCAVGCGPVAWGILFGWADIQAEQGNPYWRGRGDIYRENGGTGANAIAPRNMDEGVRNMIREIRDYVGTFCVPRGQGATLPRRMDRAQRYLSRRTSAKVEVYYSNTGRSRTEFRQKVRNSIRDRKTPAIIGIGWLRHYAVAYGYRWRKRTIRRGRGPFRWTETVYDRHFKVNQGGGATRGEWVEASTWFSGEIYP